MIGRRGVRAVAGSVFAVMGVGVLVGCAPSEGGPVPTGSGSVQPATSATPSDQALYEAGKQFNAEFKATVAQVQEQFTTDPWRVTDYGANPYGCDDRRGYYFEMGRGTPFDWTIPGDPQQWVKDLSEWLTTNGWDIIDFRTHAQFPDIDITATNPDAGVAELLIKIVPLDTKPYARVNATSTCQPGDAEALSNMQYPEPFLELTVELQAPDEEVPGAVPYFAYNDEGYAIFNDGTTYTPTPTPSPTP